MKHLILLIFLISCNLFSQNNKSFKIVSRVDSFGKFTIYQFDLNGKIRNIKDGFRMTKKDNDTIIDVDISFLYKDTLLVEVAYYFRKKLDIIALQKGIQHNIKRTDKYFFEYDNYQKLISYSFFSNIYSSKSKKNIQEQNFKTHLKYDEKFRLISVTDYFSQLLYFYDNLDRIKEIKEKEIDHELVGDLEPVPIDPKNYILKKTYNYSNDTIKTETFNYDSITKKDVLTHQKKALYQENKLLEQTDCYFEGSECEIYRKLRLSYSENGLIKEINLNNSEKPSSIHLDSNVNLSSQSIKKINDILLNNGISIFGHETSIIPMFY